MVGQDQYPALGEVRETAKLLPRGESPWWRDEGRHLLILCCFNPRDEISPHDNAKSREHAHTCRKARAICKLRYKKKKKKKNQLSGAICLTSLPHTLRFLNLSENTFDGSLNLTRLPENIRSIVLCENMFSGEIDVRHLPKSLTELDVRKNRLCGTVCTPPGVHCWDGMVQTDRLFDGNTNLTVFGPYGRHEA